MGYRETPAGPGWSTLPTCMPPTAASTWANWALPLTATAGRSPPTCLSGAGRAINGLASEPPTSAVAGTGETGYDALALASSSHTTIGGPQTTYDNYGDAALGVASL